MDNIIAQGNISHKKHPCPAEPGTVLRIFFPPGTIVNLLNLLEISSPGGICLIIRLPLLAGANNFSVLSGIMDSIKQAGGKVEVVSE